MDSRRGLIVSIAKWSDPFTATPDSSEKNLCFNEKTAKQAINHFSIHQLHVSCSVDHVCYVGSWIVFLFSVFFEGRVKKMT